MILLQQPASRSRRDAFTLIELLIVMAIIATLVGLLMAAVMQAMIKIPEVQTRTEIAEMEGALNSFMQTQGVQYVPSVLLLREDNDYSATRPNGNPNYNGLATQTHTFLLKAWGRSIGSGGPIDWNGNGNPDQVDMLLDGSQVLTFLIGGIPSNSAAGQTPQGTGFSSSKVNPSLGTRQPPYFTFQTARLTVGNFGFYYYTDPWQVQPSPKPYAFFSTNGVQNSYGTVITGCPAAGAEPYYDAVSPIPQGTMPPVWANPNGFQIISAGRNGVFGGQGSNNGAQWSSANGSLDLNGKDDQANFSQYLLMVGTQ